MPLATQSTTLFSLTAFKAWLRVTSNATIAITSLTCVGVTATAVTAMPHGQVTGQYVDVEGASQPGFNGSVPIVVTGASSFTYTVATGLTSPDPSGSITATPTSDNLLVEIADAASQEMESQTNRLFVERTLTTTFSGMGKIAQIIPSGIGPVAKPLQSISSFTMDGTVVTQPYYIDTEHGLVTFTNGGTFNWGIKNIVMDIVTGFDVQDGAALPRDIYRSGLDLGKQVWDELSAGIIAANTVSLGPSSMIIRPSKIPMSVQRVIDKWTSYGIGLGHGA